MKRLQYDRNKVKYKFQVGDLVRISGTKRVFAKAYTGGWTQEHFVVSQRIPRNPPVYKLKDLANDVLEGVFYAQELQKIIKPDDAEYQIEKVLKRRRKGKRVECLVSWLGFPEKFNSWLDSSYVKKIVK